MSDISKAMIHLKSRGIECFDKMGVLVIPVDDPSKLDSTVSTIKHMLKEIDYEKSWQVDPYYYEKHGANSPVDCPEDPCS